MTELPRIEPQLPDIPPWNEVPFAIVGEAPGKDEVEQNKPFVGASGKLLTEMLYEAGIDRENSLVTNVFLYRPPDNKVDHFFVNRVKAKKEDIEYCSELPQFNGKFLRQEFFFELNRLADELIYWKPKLIISVGATPMWVFTGLSSGITKERGNFYTTSLIPGGTVMLTYHPAYILRNRSQRNTVVDDFKRAKEYADHLLEAGSQETY